MTARTRQRTEGAPSGNSKPAAAGECLTPEPWKFLLPSNQECRRVLERFPTLTATGYHPYERYKRENDRRTELLALPTLTMALTGQALPPIRRVPLIAIDSPTVCEDIARVRLFLRSIVGDWIGAHTSYNLRNEIARWAGNPIWHGAVIAGAFLEGGVVGREGSAAVIGLRLPAAIHFRLRERAASALAVIEGALACVPR